MQIDYHHDPVLLCRGLRKMAFVVCDNAADMIEDLQTQLAWAGAHQGGLETVLNGCYTEIAELKIALDAANAENAALISLIERVPEEAWGDLWDEAEELWEKHDARIEAQP
jgi:hypothetical protein